MLEPGAENIRTPSADKSSFSGAPPIPADVYFCTARETTDEGNQLTTRNIHFRKNRIAVAIIDKHAFTRGSIARTLKKLCRLLEITSFATCDECLASTKSYDIILYHIHERVNQHSNEGQFLLLRKILPIAPVIILSDDDSYDLVCAAFDIGVRGYIPTASTTPELAIDIIHLVKRGGTFVPPSSLSPRGVSARRISDPVTTEQFTPRQMGVLHRLKQGKTNKIIAYELQISESSVKSHIRNIMNKLNATNRTEVVCRTHELRCCS